MATKRAPARRGSTVSSSNPSPPWMSSKSWSRNSPDRGISTNLGSPVAPCDAWMLSSRPFPPATPRHPAEVIADQGQPVLLRLAFLFLDPFAALRAFLGVVGDLFIAFGATHGDDLHQA